MTALSPTDYAVAARHLVANPAALLNRDYLLELFTEVDRVAVESLLPDGQAMIATETPVYVGKLVAHEGAFHRVAAFARTGWWERKSEAETPRYRATLAATGIPLPEDGPLFAPQDPLEVPPGALANAVGTEPIASTVGRFIMNHIVLADPFGDKVPYLNDTWSTGKIERTIGDLIIQEKVTVEEVKRYIQNVFFIGHATELAVPNFSEKSLTTDPKLYERKKQLLEENAEAIKAGDAVVMSKIEQELIAMDKAWLKGDESMGFYLKGKAFDITRKKMLVIGGMVEGFGQAGEYDFVPNSLIEGWRREDFPAICNEIRKGSYGRAKETAKGGEESKFLMRVLQNTRITERDCGTTRTLAVALTKANAQSYLYRNIILDDGAAVELSQETLPAYIGHTVNLRSPTRCQTANGYCFTCMGKLFETLDQKSLTMLAVSIGSYFLTLSLKGMHGTKVSTYEITNLDEFLF